MQAQWMRMSFLHDAMQDIAVEDYKCALMAGKT
jgi:hypothetical protein